MRDSLKTVANAASLIFASPAAWTCWLEKRLNRDADSVFGFWTNVFAILPGLPGLYVRRAFYRFTLDECASSCYIGFGTIITRRSARIRRGAYIGPYSLVGCATLGEGCLIGSRTSLLSGGSLHQMDEHGRWMAADPGRVQRIAIGTNAWIGEGAIIVADIGDGAMVAAGAVVSMRVAPGVMVGGNPARFIKRLMGEAAGQ
jgi:virginiamycin A acetyltransferase